MEGKYSGFKKEDIAPCGLNCGVCNSYLHQDPPCAGCRSDSGIKHDFCRNICIIPRCEKRISNGWDYCYPCSDYPCFEVMEKQTRYAAEYPVIESPMDNLDFIREKGIESFLKEEDLRWQCPVCGGRICVHDGMCTSCGKKLSEV